MERPMRLLDRGARQLAYTLEGPAGAPVLMFSNCLGTALSSWQAQAEALSRHLRVLRYDTRGHGMSGLAGVQAHGPGRAYTLAQLGGDVLRLLDALDIETADFCDIWMGGLTGLWLGVHAGSRLLPISLYPVLNSDVRLVQFRVQRERMAPGIWVN
jgi:pimeloyl-ACP methyl ester carboxylesterase